MYWLTILEKTNQELFNEINELNNEAEELRKIISTIIIKLSKKE